MVTQQRTSIDVARLSSAMRDADVSLLLVTPSADLRYLAGYAARPSERPTILAVSPDGSPLLLAPALEVARLPALEGVRVLAWQETDKPVELLVAELSLPGAPVVAVSDQMWSSLLLQVQRALPAADFVAASPLLRTLRMRKSEYELDLLRRAGALVDEVFRRVVGLPFRGRTEAEIGAEISRLIAEVGLGVPEWAPNVASGPNSASAHHLTGNREVREGDAVILDFGGVLDGYQADTTRSVHVGPPGDAYLRVYDTVQRGQEAAVRAVRPGVAAQSVDAAARDLITAAGFGPFFMHRTGHGIGLDVHEEPYIVAGNPLPLQPGMTFSIEPGIYLSGRPDAPRAGLPVDGGIGAGFGVRIEDIVAVTETGAERFNNANRDLVIVN